MESNLQPLRIAVTGATGLLGRALVPRLVACGHTVVVSQARDRLIVFPGVTAIGTDLLDPPSVAHFVDRAEADWIVHAAALTDVDRCELEPEMANAINTRATDHLVRAIATTPSRLLFISTDYVFDGLNGPYDETATEAPINVYGQTKLAAERLVQAAGEKHAIIRSASFLGIGSRGRPTFAEKMVQTMRWDPPLLAAVDQRSNITPLGFLTDAIIEITQNSQSGVRHVVGGDILPRYDFALRLARLFSLGSEAVRPVEYHELNRPAGRPLNGGLRSRFALGTPQIPLAVALTDWREALLRNRALDSPK